MDVLKVDSQKQVPLTLVTSIPGKRIARLPALIFERDAEILGEMPRDL